MTPSIKSSITDVWILQENQSWDFGEVFSFLMIGKRFLGLMKVKVDLFSKN